MGVVIEVEVEKGGVGVSVGWPDGPNYLSCLVAAVWGVHPSRAPQGVKVGDSMSKCVCVSVCV